jgi:hypothetical protein
VLGDNAHHDAAQPRARVSDFVHFADASERDHERALGQVFDLAALDTEAAHQAVDAVEVVIVERSPGAVALASML